MMLYDLDPDGVFGTHPQSRTSDLLNHGTVRVDLWRTRGSGL